MSNTDFQLVKKILIEGKILAISGLHIGGTNSAMSIGGVDNSIIRNPLTNEPYLPGSSLKGKMRSLLELNYGEIGSTRMGAIDNGPTESQNTHSGRLFGNANFKEKQRPSRVIVRDCQLRSKAADFENTDLPFTEVKTEVVIDRITSKAMPRQIERVPAGAEFSLYLVLNIFGGTDKDNEKELVNDLFASLQLLQDDYLGGSGSRGSGQVKFQITKVVERTADYYKKKGEEANKTETYKEQFENLFV